MTIDLVGSFLVMYLQLLDQSSQAMIGCDVLGRVIVVVI